MESEEIVTRHTKFVPGDRVKRHEDVFDQSSRIKYGTVTCVYGKRLESSLGRWDDPELYEVQWDDGTVGRSYFPHGIDPVNRR